MALASEILPTVLSSIAAMDCKDISEKEREAYARFALEMVWTIERSDGTDSAHTSSRKIDIAVPLNLYKNWTEKMFVEAILESLKAAEHVLRNLNEDRYLRDTRTMVEAVAERFARLRYLKEIPQPDFETRVTIKSVKKDWRIIGHFMESSPYRLHAIHYYEAILEMPDFIMDTTEIGNALSRSSERKKHRDQQKDDALLFPDDKIEEDGIFLHFFRNGLTFQISDSDEGYQCRFMLNKKKIEVDQEIIHNHSDKSELLTEGTLTLTTGSSQKWLLSYQWEKETGKVRLRLPSGRWIKFEKMEKKNIRE